MSTAITSTSRIKSKSLKCQIKIGRLLSSNMNVSENTTKLLKRGLKQSPSLSLDFPTKSSTALLTCPVRSPAGHIYDEQISVPFSVLLRLIAAEQIVPSSSGPATSSVLRKYVCNFPPCERRFTKISHLKSHLRRHTNERPHHCKWLLCNKSFCRSDELLRHERLHSGLRPHSCLTCGKSFSRSDHLKKHLMFHGKHVDVKSTKTPSDVGTQI